MDPGDKPFHSLRGSRAWLLPSSPAAFQQGHHSSFSLSAPSTGVPGWMITLKRHLWGSQQMPLSHIWRRAVGGTFLRQFLFYPQLSQPPHPGNRNSSRVSGGLQEVAERLLPCHAQRPPLTCSGENPGPQNTVWGDSGQHVGDLPIDHWLLSEINEPAPHSQQQASSAPPPRPLLGPECLPPLPVPFPLNSHQIETLQSPDSRGMAC